MTTTKLQLCLNSGETSFGGLYLKTECITTAQQGWAISRFPSNAAFTLRAAKVQTTGVNLHWPHNSIRLWFSCQRFEKQNDSPCISLSSVATVLLKCGIRCFIWIQNLYHRYLRHYCWQPLASSLNPAEFPHIPVISNHTYKHITYKNLQSSLWCNYVRNREKLLRLRWVRERVRSVICVIYVRQRDSMYLQDNHVRPVLFAQAHVIH